MNKQGFGPYLFICALLICDIAVHCVRAQSSQPFPSIVRTHELEIINQAGKVTAKIFNSPRGDVNIVMYDQKGRKRLSVGAANESAAFDIYDSHGQNDIMIGGGDAPMRSPQVVVCKDNLPSVDMYSDVGGRSGVGVFDDKLTPRVSLDYQNDDESEVAVFDKRHNKRAAMGYYGPIDASTVAVEDNQKGAELTCEQGDSAVSASDKSTRRAELVYMPQADTPKIVVNNKGGKPIWSAPVSPPQPSQAKPNE